jgi:hypothetical protein
MGCHCRLSSEGQQRKINTKRGLWSIKKKIRKKKKSSASGRRQATHIGKISGCCKICGGCNYNIKMSLLM